MDAVKFTDISETTVVGLAAPFGGPFNGRDLDGEFFTKSTDFALDWYDEIPLLYHHGRDNTMQTTVVGRVKSRSMVDEGVWAEAQLDHSNKYFEVIRRMIKAGKLFFSSGSVSHLVQSDRKSGEISRWPMIELSLTPTPSNLLAVPSAKATGGIIPDPYYEIGSQPHLTILPAVALPAEHQVSLKAALDALSADLDAILARP